MNLIPELREAFVVGLIDGVLNPDNVPGGAQVSVFYDDMLRGDQVELRWMTSLPNGSYVAIQSVQDDGQPLPFSVPYYVLDAGRGLDATLDYSSTRNGAVRQSYARLIPIRSTVVPLPPPTIATVKDPQNREIAQGGVTTATTVTLAGEAAVEQQVQVFDGAVSKGIVQTDASGGWVHAVPGLAVGAHSFTARGLYGSNPHSAAWALTVQAELVPTIVSVRDPYNNEVPDGGSTYSTSVLLAGKANAGQRVEVFDGATSRGNADVNGAGDWTFAPHDLAAGAHGFTAKALYGSGQVSNIRRLTVQRRTTLQETFEGSPVTVITGQLDTPTMVISRVSGLVEIRGSHPDSQYPPYLVDKHLGTQYAAQLSMRLKSPAVSVRFGLGRSNTAASDVTVGFYDPWGALMYSNVYTRTQWVVYDAPQGRTIQTITASAQYSLGLDNFTFTV